MNHNNKKSEIIENELNSICANTVSLFLELKRFYNVTSKGLPLGIENDMKETFQSLTILSQTGKLDSFLVQGVTSNDFMKIIEDKQEEINHTTQKITQRIIDAASIVFAHGIIEECVYGYLYITAKANPEIWEPYVEKKKIDLTGIKGISFTQIRSNKIDELLKNDVKNESLIDKLDRLHRIAPPTKYITDAMGFKYEREKVISFDKTRQDIVHGNNWRSYKFDFYKDVSYWNNLNFYLAAIVCNKTGLKLSPEKLGHNMADWSKKYEILKNS